LAAVDVITVDPNSVDFGSLSVTADPTTRQITVTNTGIAAITLGGVDIAGTGSDAFSLQTNLGPDGVTLGLGESKVLDLNFDPVTTGLKTAQVTLTDATGVAIVGVPTVTLTGQDTNPGNCTITGIDNSETLRGTAGKDVICALGGNDRVNGLGTDDVLRGGKGSDRITHKKGKDKLFGQGGKDRLSTRDGNRGDLLKGGGGKDRCTKDKRDRARSC
jgi:hypothetical protein